MKDRRKFERFAIVLPSRMEAIVSNKRQIFNLKTRDISASGAFVNTSEMFSEGTRFKMDFTLPANKIKELTGVQSMIECEGIVVRTTPTGVAICFDKGCEILSLKG